MLACDFLHVDCAVTLRRVYVFFVIGVGTRYVRVPGVTTNPDGAWTVQAAHTYLMDLGEHADRFRFLIRDRAGQFTGVFDAVFTAAGIEVIRTPPRCPQANAHAERWVRTLRGEFADRMLIFGQRHLRHVLAEYVEHYNHSRPHRALSLLPPRPHRPPSSISTAAPSTAETDPRRADQRVRASRVDRHEATGHRRYGVLSPYRSAAESEPGSTYLTYINLWL